MSLKQQLILGKDVEERTAWGMDMYTAINLCLLRPRDVPGLVFSEFLEHRLMMAIQQQKLDGYDIRAALNFIINSEPKYETTGEESYKPLSASDLSLWTNKGEPLEYSYMEKELARVILEAV